MTINIIKNVAVAAVICGAAGAASAATFSFNFGAETLPAQLSHQFSAVGSTDPSDPTVTVTGRTEAGAVRHVKPWLTNGIGLEANRDSHTIDSEGYDDIAVLTFSEAVSVTSLSFNYGTAGSTFDLLVEPGSNQSVAFSGTIGNSVATGLEDDDLFSTVWGVQATERDGKFCLWTFCVPVTKDAHFKLAGVTVTTEDPSPVPVPAAGALLLGALGGLAALRRKA